MQAIERAFSVLRALRDARGSAGVSAVARATGLPKSTVSRLLVGLEAEGAVERLDAAGNYAIGPGLAALIGTTSSAVALRDIARPHLRHLVDELQESSGLTVPDGDTALYMDHLASDGSVRTRDWTGMRFPFHTIAGGLAMMMTWSGNAVDDYAAGGLEAFTANTIVTRKALRARLVQARRDGYVWTLGDFDSEIHGVAAPVRDQDGNAIGAINVYGPSYRFPGAADPDDVGRLVRKAARSVQDRHRAV